MSAPRCNDVNEYFPSYRCEGEAGHDGVHWASHEDGKRIVSWLEPGPGRPFHYANTSAFLEGRNW